MAYLSREQILKSDDLQREEVSVPEWGGTVLVRGLTGKERDAFEVGMLSVSDKSISLKMDNARARLVSLGCIDENGDKLFTLSDVKSLGEKSGAALDRVSDAIRRLSGLNEQDMGELMANFTIGQNGGSTSV